MTLVGAYRDARESGAAEGSAYLFSQVDGTWVQQAKLTPDTSGSGDYFGFSVGISGDGSTIIIGARRDDNPVGVGAGYIFTRTDGSWAQQAKLTTSDTAADSVGKSVGISRDGATVVVGADGTDEPNGANAGSAYVFTRDGGSWTQQKKLLPADGDEGDGFGRRVAMSGDGSTVLVSAPEDGDPNGQEAGSASVFTLSGGAWTRQAKLAPDGGQARDQFGSSVALSSDGATAIAAAPRNENTNGIEAGSAYVFSRGTSSWTQEAKLSTDDGEPGDLFGSSVGLSADGTTAFLGAKNDENANGTRAGAVYEFTRTSGGWSQQTKLTPENGDAEDLFGFSVGVSDTGSMTAVGVPWDEDLNGQYAGSAYVFE